VKGKILHKKLIDVDSDVEGEEETAPEKRLRLAKEYLLQLDEEGESCHDSTWSSHHQLDASYWSSPYKVNYMYK